jgi:hypothetical protein
MDSFLTQKKNLRVGLTRLALTAAALVGGYVVFFVLFTDAFPAFLKWIEFLAPAAGLSGLWVVFMIPIAFLFTVCAGGWIIGGFKEDVG